MSLSLRSCMKFSFQNSEFASGSSYLLRGSTFSSCSKARMKKSVSSSVSLIF